MSRRIHFSLSMVLVMLLSAFAGGAPLNGDEKEPAVCDGQAGDKKPPSPETTEATERAPAARSLDIVIARHVILWDGRIRTWDEVVTELREIRQAKGEPIHPHFYFTNGAHSAGHFDRYKAKVWEVYRELFEPAGVTYGSISPRAATRYDRIRKAADLMPDPPALRSGIVVEKGEPKADVLVVLVPEEGPQPIVLKADLTLREPHDEVWTTTGPDGRFTLAVHPIRARDDAERIAEPTYSLAAISRTGYGLASIPMKGEEARIELLPPGYVQLTPVEGRKQAILLRLGGRLPDPSPGFAIYGIELRDEALLLRLPPGKITVRRVFGLGFRGGSRSYPAETVQLDPGGSRKVTLPNITEAEAKQMRIEESRRPQRDSKPGK